MKRLGWILALGGPWLAVAIMLWREQTLEQAVARFVAASNAAMQQHVGNLAEAASGRMADEMMEGQEGHVGY